MSNTANAANVNHVIWLYT